MNRIAFTVQLADPIVVPWLQSLAVLQTEEEVTLRLNLLLKITWWDYSHPTKLNPIGTGNSDPIQFDPCTIIGSCSDNCATRHSFCHFGYGLDIQSLLSEWYRQLWRHVYVTLAPCQQLVRENI